MNIKSLGVFVVLGFSSALAAGLATPSVVPVDQIPVPPARAVNAAAAPTTQPAAVATINGKIVVLPFEAIGDVQNRAWVSRAVQQSLTSEVARLGGLLPVSITVANPADTGVARDTAAAQGADVVIFGSTQLSGTEVRLIGEIVKVSTGQAIAGLKASGDFKDLFALEDEIGSQMDRALRPPAPVVAAAAVPDTSMVFGSVAPTPADLFPAPTDQSRFSNEYQQYYTAPPAYDPYLYGGFVYPFYGGAYFPYGGGYGSIVVIHGGGHSGRGHADADSPTMPAPRGGGMPQGAPSRGGRLAAGF